MQLSSFNLPFSFRASLLFVFLSSVLEFHPFVFFFYFLFLFFSPLFVYFMLFSSFLLLFSFMFFFFSPSIPQLLCGFIQSPISSYSPFFGLFSFFLLLFSCIFFYVMSFSSILQLIWDLIHFLFIFIPFNIDFPMYFFSPFIWYSFSITYQHLFVKCSPRVLLSSFSLIILVYPSPYRIHFSFPYHF